MARKAKQQDESAEKVESAEATEPAENDDAQVDGVDIDDLDEAGVNDLAEKMRAEAEEDEAQAQETDHPEDGEDKAEGDQSDDKAEEQQDSVSFDRFHHERERRKAAEQQSQEVERRMQMMLDRLSPEQQQEAKNKPGPDDPMGRINYVFETIQKQEQETATERREREQQEAQQREISRVVGEAQSEFQEAVEADPTLPEAYEAVRQSLANEMRLYYPSNEIEQRLQQAEIQHIAWARQSGIPISQYVKNLAQSRGWTPGASASQQDDQGNGAQKQVEQIQKREETQRRAASLGNGGGAVPDAGQVTPEKLLAMSEKEFEAWIDEHGSVEKVFQQ